MIGFINRIGLVLLTLLILLSHLFSGFTDNIQKSYQQSYELGATVDKQKQDGLGLAQQLRNEALLHSDLQQVKQQEALKTNQVETIKILLLYLLCLLFVISKPGTLSAADLSIGLLGCILSQDLAGLLLASLLARDFLGKRYGLFANPLRLLKPAPKPKRIMKGPLVSK
jgi:hypothetical protein